MKVVFCAYDGKNIINGINVWLTRLLPQLAQNNIQVSVLFIAWAAENDCTTIPLLRAKNINCIIIPTAHYTEKQVKWILQYLQTENPDVFVPGNMVSALYAAKWVKQAGIKTIAVLHNDDEEYAAIINHFISIQNDTYLTAVVSVSLALNKKAGEQNRNIKTYLIPYGAPVPERKTTYKTGEVFKVVYVGRIVEEQKRISDIATSFCKCAQHLPQASFYIYGSGPDEARVHDIIKAHHNPPNVFFPGGVSTEEVTGILLSSHVIVLMSDYEGIPVALMEAMACGVIPVCKSISSGIPELVQEDVTGSFIDKPEDLELKIEYLQNNTDKWEEISLNCKKLIETKFSATKNLTDWISLLNEIADNDKKTIIIPHHIQLPSVHPQLVSLDRREPSILVKAYRKIKRVLIQ